MKLAFHALAATTLAALAFSVAAQAQQPTRIRGTISALDGNVLTVKTRDGKDVKISLPDNLTVVAAKKITFDDIKPGDFVGPASKTRADGKLEAISLQLFPANLRGVVPEGHTPWDLERGTDGVLFTQRIAVSKDGARPAN